MATEQEETAEGNGVQLHFRAARCIHSRHCVLDRPDVFVPNVQGEWLHPERASAAEIAELAHRCPSGAITYERTDGGPNEAAPRVNVVRVLENGPLAFHGELDIQGHGKEFRGTLCRCGLSAHKPFCDGSHTRGFQASGEPAAAQSEALAVRGGPLSITPTPNGPLGVTGPLEIVSGTGRTLNRTQRVFLCRCGASGNKPYCDGSHKKVGFSG